MYLYGGIRIKTNGDASIHAYNLDRGKKDKVRSFEEDFFEEGNARCDINSRGTTTINDWL